MTHSIGIEKIIFNISLQAKDNFLQSLAFETRNHLANLHSICPFLNHSISPWTKSPHTSKFTAILDSKKALYP